MFLIDHVALSVVDMETSIDFYKMFGFVKFNEWKADDNSLHMVMLKNNNETYMELVCARGSKQLPNSSRDLDLDLFQVGVKHIALRVKSVEEMIGYLNSKSITNYSKIRMGKLGRKYFYINDPNGIVMEFIEE